MSEQRHDSDRDIDPASVAPPVQFPGDAPPLTRREARARELAAIVSGGSPEAVESEPVEPEPVDGDLGAPEEPADTDPEVEVPEDDLEAELEHRQEDRPEEAEQTSGSSLEDDPDELDTTSAVPAKSKSRRRRNIAIAAAAALALVGGAVAVGVATNQPETGTAFEPGQTPAGYSSHATFGSTVEFEGSTTAGTVTAPAVSDQEYAPAAESGRTLVTFEVTVENRGENPIALAGIQVVLPANAEQVFDRELGAPQQVGNLDAGAAHTWTVAALVTGPIDHFTVGLRPSPILDRTVEFRD